MNLVNDETSRVVQARKAMPEHVEEFVTAALVAAGTELQVARSVAEALTQTSLRGVDSHGIRLLVHYVKVVQEGRINPKPQVSFQQTGVGTGTVDADNGFGHYASFLAVDRAVELARVNGIAAVSVINSSHFGAAGCYALRAAESGFLGICVCNSDSFVLPHNGIHPFHGTNPLAFAAPVAGSSPYLVDMATSLIPWNRVQDLMNEGFPLPADAAVDQDGVPTIDPANSAALLPLGGIRYGYKGAALASMIEVLSAVLTGMPYCSQLIPMAGPDFSTFRRLGHLVIAIGTDSFISKSDYYDAARSYLDDLRSQTGRNGSGVLAPGDREWQVKEDRQENGIPIADQLRSDLDTLAMALGIDKLHFQ